MNLIEISLIKMFIMISISGCNPETQPPKLTLDKPIMTTVPSTPTKIAVNATWLMKN
jgi:hypothetical protein